MFHSVLWNPKKVIVTAAYADACEALKVAIKEGKRPALTLVLDRSERLSASKAAAHLAGFQKIIVFGTGGSSLGGQAICKLQKNSRIVFVDNVDPQTYENLLNTCDPHTTGAIIISKSGNTLETLSQAYIFTQYMFKHVGKEALSQHIMCLSEDTNNPLRQLAHDLSLPHYALSPHIGGRYCVFSMVGLLPGMLDGLDMDAFCEGAAHILTRFLDQKDTLLQESLAFQSEQINLGRSQHVIIPYSDRLWTYAQWAQQLIGESLGKQGKGITPIAARGTVDQHSQLQLYMDGPEDKWITFITCRDSGMGTIIEAPWVSADFSYLRGKTIGDVMHAEHQATLTTLAEAGRHVREIVINQPDERSLGALMMYAMLDVMLLSHILEVNPFDQPAVEAGKVIAKDLLSAKK